MVLPSFSWAQNTGTITGKVNDQTGEPLYFANVYFDQETERGSLTDWDGQFVLENVVPGTYTLVASYIGYKTVTQRITVAAGQTTTANYELEEDLLEMDAVVVSGSFNAATKLTSSTPITTINQQDIENRTPRGIGDLLKVVPGVQIMSEGGEVGANINIRGLPQGNGSFKYLTLKEEGLPVFEIPDLYFAFADQMFAIDETIDRMEVVRGGSSSIFASNNPGSIVNFISKGGGNVLTGIVKFTYGSQGSYRPEFNLGGPLTDKWKVNVGGFYLYDRGVRPPADGAFPTNEGVQIKANLTREITNGYVRTYARFLNQSNLWYLGIPYQNINDPEAVPGGPTIDRGTIYSGDLEKVTYPDPFNPGQTVTNNLGKGLTTNTKVLGVELYKELGGGWSTVVKSKYMQAHNESSLLVSDVSNPIPALAFTANPELGPLAMFSQLQYVNSGEIIENAAQLNGNGLLLPSLMTALARPVSNFITDVQFSNQYGEHVLTGGIYFSGYRVESQITQNVLLTDLAEAPQLLQLTVPEGLLNPQAPSPTGAPFPIVAPGGFLNVNSGFSNAENSSQITALYLGDEWRVNPKLRLDGGVRLDMSWHEGRNERPINPNAISADRVFPVGYVPTGEEDLSKGMFGSGIYRRWNYHYVNVNGSLGLNYQLTGQQALFARLSRGTRTPDVKQWELSVDNNDLVTGNTVEGTTEKIVQGEFGFKASFNKLGIFSNIFYTQVTGLQRSVQFVTPDQGLQFLQIPAGSRTWGSELEVVYSPINNLQFKTITTLQAPRWTQFSYEITIPGEGPYSGVQVRNYEGNQIKDVSQVLLDIQVSYKVKTFMVYANYRYTGKRPATENNVFYSPAYSEVFGGLSYTYKNVTLGVRGSNLLGTQAIQQTLVRIGENVIGADDQGFIRVIDPATGEVSSTNITGGRGLLPRNLLFSLTYQF